MFDSSREESSSLLSLPLFALLCALGPPADHLEGGLALVDPPSLSLDVRQVVGHMVGHLQWQLGQLSTQCLPPSLWQARVSLRRGRRRGVLGPLAVVAVEGARGHLIACVERSVLDCLALCADGAKTDVKFVEEARKGGIIEVVSLELGKPACRLLQESDVDRLRQLVATGIYEM